MSEKWIEGATARINVVVKNDAAVLFDPTSIVLKVQAPNTTATTTHNPVRDSLGTYHFDLLLERKGIYTYRWEADQGVSEGQIQVYPSLLK